jgi:hypothetical protein
LPQEWVNALNSAVAAGKIPNISLSTVTPGNVPVYPNGTDPTSPGICSGSYKCMIQGDIWNAPNGTFASAFDDGPTQVSYFIFFCCQIFRLSDHYPKQFTPTLVEFLQSKNEITTHFMIGSNILNNPNQFSTAFGAGHDIAVHTFTHPYMTTKSNLELLGEVNFLVPTSSEHWKTNLLIYYSLGGQCNLSSILPEAVSLNSGDRLLVIQMSGLAPLPEKFVLFIQNIMHILNYFNG